MRGTVRPIALFLLVVSSTAGCGPTPQIISQTVEFTREVEVTRLVGKPVTVIVKPPAGVTKPVTIIIGPTPSRPLYPPLPTPLPPLPDAVAADTAALRAGPGVSYEIVGTVQPGEELKVLATSPQGDWFKIVMAGAQEAWVPVGLVTVYLSPFYVPIDRDLPASGPLAPTLPPSTGRIAFNSDRDGNLEIYIMKADGSEQTRLTNNPAYDGAPSWSPG